MLKGERYKNLTNSDWLLIARRKNATLSKGESAVAEFLKNNGINFYREFFFTEMVVSGKPKKLFFDFYLPEYNACIEFDGIQHYTGYYKGKKIKDGYKKDFIKTSFCHNKGIKLLRIKYTDIDNIESIICQWFDKNF